MRAKFIAYVFLLNALCDNELLTRDPNDRNNVLVKRDDIPEDAWASMNIFTLAQELFDSEKQRKTLFALIREKGKVPVFSNSGDFIGLRNVA